MSKSAPFAATKSFSPVTVQRPAQARVGDFVERIFGVSEEKNEVVISCRLNPDDLWTFTPCLFARIHRNDPTKPQWKRIE